MKRDYSTAIGHDRSAMNHFVDYSGGNQSIGPMAHHGPNHYYNQHQHHQHHHQQQHYYGNNINYTNSHQQSSSYSAYASNKGKQLMSFQNYVRQMNNSVDENTACKKYKEFMAELSQSKVSRFFDANKDHEWFRLKYHPNESQALLHQQNVNFANRLDIFNDLNDKNFFDRLPLDENHSDAIIDLMNAIIIKLEDGPQDIVDRLLTPDGIKIEPELMRKFIPNKPTSIIIDDVSIETTLAEIQEICTQAHPNLRRIAQLEPYYIAEGILRRKLIVVYDSDVNIKDVCWKLSRIKLNNRLLNVSINKLLDRRVRVVDVLANHHLSIVNDIRNAIILILNFDEQKGLYGKRKQLLETIKKEVGNLKVNIKQEHPSQDDESEHMDDIAPLSPPGSDKSANDDDDAKPFDVGSFDEEKEKEKKKLFEFKFNAEPSLYRLYSKLNKSKNPILNGAQEYCVEFIESSVARYMLSKVAKDLLDENSKEELDNIEINKITTLEMIVKNLPFTIEQSTRFLDKLIWYLRIVHSFDYYKMSIYRLEDELTLRMGVIHVRGAPQKLMPDVDKDTIEEFLKKTDKLFDEFGFSQSQKYVTKDEERFNYKSYGKVITDELTSYSQRIPKPKSTETEEVYKCRHCTKVFQKMSDIGRHFVSKHKWAIDTIELDTDFFNAYLFDATKMNPCPPKELLELPPNRFANMTSLSEMGEDPDLLLQTIEAYSKMESFVREPAPRAQTENDPRNETIVDYTDISFDDAI